MLKLSVHNNDELANLSTLIFQHNSSCKEENCNCKIINFQKFYNRLNFKKDYVHFHEEILLKKFQKALLEIINCIEKEIGKNISLIKNSIKEDRVEIFDYILLHVDFILHFQRNVQMSSYLKNSYIMRHNRYNSMEFIYFAYFHELERKIIKMGKSSIDFSHKEINIEFYNHIQLLDYLQELILKNVNNYQTLLKIKKFYTDRKSKSKNSKENETIYFNNQTVNADDIFACCYKMKKEYHELYEFLKNNFSEFSFKNTEISYLLTNFFNIVDGKIPYELEYCFLYIEKYSDLLLFENSFEEKGKQHPIILQLDNKSFIINYISQKLCDYMRYKKDELLGHDIHVLFPQIFREIHSSVMRKFILLKNKSHLQKEIFFVTSDGYFFPVNITFDILPALEDIKMIIDVHQVKDINSKFFFILDEDCKLITFNRDFEVKFSLTSEMFDQMQINILSLFGIYPNQILTDFKNYIDEITNTYIKENDREENFRENATLEHSFTNFSKMKTIMGNNKTIVRFKPMSVNYLNKLQAIIQDNELSKEWLSRINNLEKDIYKLRTANKLMKMSKSNCLNSIENFQISIELKNLINVPFFVVTINDSESFNTIHNPVTKSYYNNSATKLHFFLDKIKGGDKKFNMTKIDMTENNQLTTKLDGNDSLKDQSHMGLLLTKHLHQNNSKKVMSYENSSYNESATDSASVFSYYEKKQVNKRFRAGFSNKDKRNKKSRQRLVIYLLFLCLIILVFLSIYNVFFTTEILDISYNLFLINYDTILLKSAIIYSGTAVVSMCLKTGVYNNLYTDGFETTFLEYKTKLKNRSFEINYYKYRLQKNLVLYNYVPGIKNITELFSSIDTYSIMSPNWETYDRNSSFSDELNRLNYHVANLENDNMYDNCVIGKEGVTSTNSNTKANYGEMTTHYIIKNVMTKFRYVLRSIFTETSTILNIYHLNSENTLLIFNVSILFIFILLCAFNVFTIYIYRAKIFEVFKNFFTDKYQDIYLEKKLINFKRVLISLDRNVGLKFEKKKEDLLFEIEELKEKRKNSSREMKKDKFNLLTTTTNNNQIIPLDKQDTTNNDDSFDENLFEMKIVKNSLFIILVFLIVYIVVIIINIVSNNKDFETLLFANSISMCFMDRMPKFAEMVLYFKISILLENLHYLETKQSDYAELGKVFNAYNFEFYLENHSLYQSLGNSDFNYLLYILQLERRNIQAFMDSANNNILPNVRTIENLYNGKDSCFAVGYYNMHYLFNKNVEGTINFTKKFVTMSDYVNECKTINLGMNLLGLSNALDNHYNALTSLYLDFYVANVKNTTKTILDDNFMRAQINSDFTLKKANNGIVEFIAKDMGDTYSKMKNIELIFSSLKMILSFSFIFYFVFFVLIKIQNYFYYLNYGIKKFSKAIKNI